VDTGTFAFKESTMAKTRPPYTPEFRRQMIERGGHRPLAGPAGREFEPTAQSIRKWLPSSSVTLVAAAMD